MTVPSRLPASGSGGAEKYSIIIPCEDGRCDQPTSRHCRSGAAPGPGLAPHPSHLVATRRQLDPHGVRRPGHQRHRLAPRRAQGQPGRIRRSGLSAHADDRGAHHHAARRLDRAQPRLAFVPQAPALHEPAWAWCSPCCTSSWPRRPSTTCSRATSSTLPKRSSRPPASACSSPSPGPGPSPTGASTRECSSVSGIRSRSASARASASPPTRPCSPWVTSSLECPASWSRPARWSRAW